MPQKKPRPRMSPTCGCAAQRLGQLRAEGRCRLAHLGHEARRAGSPAAPRAPPRRPSDGRDRCGHAGRSRCPWTSASTTAPAREHRADRLVAAAQALGDRHQVGGARPPARRHAASRRAAHAAHHLVEDQQHAALVAHRAHRLEVTGHRRQHAGPWRRPRSRPRRRSRGRRPAPRIAASKLGREAQAVLLGALVRARLLAGTMSTAPRAAGDQDRREGLAPPGVAAHRERAQRVAVADSSGGAR